MKAREDPNAKRGRGRGRFTPNERKARTVGGKWILLVFASLHIVIFSMMWHLYRIFLL